MRTNSLFQLVVNVVPAAMSRDPILKMKLFEVKLKSSDESVCSIPGIERSAEIERFPLPVSYQSLCAKKLAEAFLVIVWVLELANVISA